MGRKITRLKQGAIPKRNLHITTISKGQNAVKKQKIFLLASPVDGDAFEIRAPTSVNQKSIGDITLLSVDRCFNSKEEFKYDPMFNALSSSMKQTKSIRVPSPTPTCSSTDSAVKQNIEFIRAIHNYSFNPETFKTKVQESRKKLKKYAREAYNAKETIRKLREKMKLLQEIIINLTDTGMLTPKGFYYLQNSLNNEHQDLLR